MAGTAGSNAKRACVEQVRVNTGVSKLTEHIVRFNKPATITALLAGTAVNLLSDATVPASDGVNDVAVGYTVILEGFRVKVKGTTPWATTGTILTIQDTAGQVFATIAVAALTANAYLWEFSANVTLDPLFTNTGGRLTLSKGLQIKGDANFGAGSDVIVTVFGYIEKLS